MSPVGLFVYGTMPYLYTRGPWSWLGCVHVLGTLAISMAGLSSNPVLCWLVGALKLALAIMQATKFDI